MELPKRIVACLNGDRAPGAHPALPSTPEALADDTRAAIAAGATEVHVHPRDIAGAQTLDQDVVAETLRAVRWAAPQVPISVTTSLSAEPDPLHRFDLVGRWFELPDLVTVNLHEPGSVELVRLLADRNVDVEAGLWTPAAARVLIAGGLAELCRYVLIEPMDQNADDALATYREIIDVLDDEDVDADRLLHGEGAPVWPVFDAAVAAGLDVRIGLEDTLEGPDGAPVAGNAELVRTAVARIKAAEAPLPPADPDPAPPAEDLP